MHARTPHFHIIQRIGPAALYWICCIGGQAGQGRLSRSLPRYSVLTYE